jgi:hypothetical protein
MMKFKAVLTTKMLTKACGFDVSNDSVSLKRGTLSLASVHDISVNISIYKNFTLLIIAQ